MTEPMKTVDLDLLIDRIWSRAYLDTKEKHVSLIEEYAAQQVAAERERIKKLAKETRDEETNSIWIPQLFELIDSL